VNCGQVWGAVCILLAHPRRDGNYSDVVREMPKEGTTLGIDSRSPKRESPSQLIDAGIEELGDWRGETYKSVVKTTFAKGASFEDPARVINSSLDGNTRRAIDFHEGDKINEQAFVALVRAAVARNSD
jgi:hypothetical protein